MADVPGFRFCLFLSDCLSATRLALSGLVVSFWGFLSSGFWAAPRAWVLRASTRGSGPFYAFLSSSVVCCSQALFLFGFVPCRLPSSCSVCFALLFSLLFSCGSFVLLLLCLVCCVLVPRGFLSWGYRWLASSSHWHAAASSYIFILLKQTVFLLRDWLHNGFPSGVR